MMNRLPRSLLAVLAVAIAVSSLPGSGAAEEDVGHMQRIKTFKKAVVSKDPKARQRAFDYLRDAVCVPGMEALVWGVKRVKQEALAIDEAQKETEALYEAQINKLHEAQQDFETSARTSRDLKQYNKKERKISKARDGAIKRLKNLENDHTRIRSVMQQATMVAEEILTKLDDESLAGGLEPLNRTWLGGKTLEDQLRWVDAVGEVKRPLIIQNLHAVAASEEKSMAVRVACILALAAMGDGQMLGKALEMLKLPADQDGLIKAAITALRRVHDRRAIVPLVEFLARDDLNRLREDAHKALVSLTGEDHGPYPEEWRKWWEDAHETFVMPKAPKPTGDVKQPEKGSTFYGIHTFSDRILYIVDISGSMDRNQRAKGASGKTKWDVCKQELTGSVNGLNVGETFNVVFFNHQVIPWQNRMVVVSAKTQKMLAKWVEEQIPLGGTNIFDSLERGFRIAAFGTTGVEKPPVDTVFFLTDGKPTAGRIQDPKKILELIREWNEVAQLTIHAIGIGEDHDAEFMRELARIGDGRYVAR